MDECVDFPESEVAGVKQDATVLCVRVNNPFFPFELDPREHLVWPHRAEFQQDNQQAAEVRKHVAADRLTFLFTPARKCGTQVLDGELPVASIEV
jgi:hypothetical protein